jgi:hypothetical protein
VPPQAVPCASKTVAACTVIFHTMVRPPIVLETPTNCLAPRYFFFNHHRQTVGLASSSPWNCNNLISPASDNGCIFTRISDLPIIGLNRLDRRGQKCFGPVLGERSSQCRSLPPRSEAHPPGTLMGREALGTTPDSHRAFMPGRLSDRLSGAGIHFLDALATPKDRGRVQSPAQGEEHRIGPARPVPATDLRTLREQTTAELI